MPLTAERRFRFDRHTVRRRKTLLVVAPLLGCLGIAPVEHGIQAVHNLHLLARSRGIFINKQYKNDCVKCLLCCSCIR